MATTQKLHQNQNLCPLSCISIHLTNPPPPPSYRPTGRLYPDPKPKVSTKIVPRPLDPECHTGPWIGSVETLWNIRCFLNVYIHMKHLRKHCGNT